MFCTYKKFLASAEEEIIAKARHVKVKMGFQGKELKNPINTQNDYNTLLFDKMDCKTSDFRFDVADLHFSLRIELLCSFDN